MKEKRLKKVQNNIKERNRKKKKQGVRYIKCLATQKTISYHRFLLYTNFCACKYAKGAFFLNNLGPYERKEKNDRPFSMSFLISFNYNYFLSENSD